MPSIKAAKKDARRGSPLASTPENSAKKECWPCFTPAIQADAGGLQYGPKYMGYPKRKHKTLSAKPKSYNLNP